MSSRAMGDSISAEAPTVCWRSMSYGSRARIGYTCPVYLAEIFPCDFYKIVPDGVTLVTATASVWQGTPEEMKRSAETSLAAAREMARIGCNIVIFGGV